MVQRADADSLSTAADLLERCGREAAAEAVGRRVLDRGLDRLGLDVDALGRVFATYGTNECHIRAYDKNGQPVDFDRKITVNTRRGPQTIPVAVSGVVGYGGSIRLDRKDNSYGAYK